MFNQTHVKSIASNQRLYQRKHMFDPRGLQKFQIYKKQFVHGTFFMKFFKILKTEYLKWAMADKLDAAIQYNYDDDGDDNAGKLQQSYA